METIQKKSYRLVFLDIDGVLNCKSTVDKVGPYRGIEDEKVALLKKLVLATKSKLILVSSWKEHWYRQQEQKSQQDELANYLDEKLLKYGLKITAKVSDYECLGRGHSINKYINYIKEKGIDIASFIILDDHSHDYKESGLLENLVKTNFNSNGLTQKHINKALLLLKQ